MLDDLLYRLSQSPGARRLLTPATRAYLRYCPGTAGKEALWTRVVDPYLAWHSYPYTARTRFGPRLAGDIKDMVQQYVYFFGLWEPQLTHWISTRLRPGDTFVDVGANIGYYSLLASKLVGNSGSVVAIEASATIFRQLQANLELNHITNVRSLNVAAADRRGKLELFDGPRHNAGATSLFQGKDSKPAGQVDAAPLGELLRPAELAGARLIKIDIEGAEGAVLPGLIPLLSDCRTDLELVVEFHPQNLTEPGKTVPDLIAMVRAAGFVGQVLENDYWPFSKPSLSVAPLRLQSPITKELMVVFSRSG
jgi:FkbM family methyltransferase